LNALTQIPSYVVDISEETHIELEFPYTQDAAYLPTPEILGDIEWGDNVSPANGKIFVYVQNALTSPVASAPVGILMSACAYDVKFMAPKEPSVFHTYISQSGSTLTQTDPKPNPIVDVSDTPNEQDLVYGGENIPSLRKVMRRHCHVWSHFYVAPPAGLYKATIYSSLYPFSPTYSNNANNIFIDVGGDRVNYASHSFVSWFSPCFAARRGSMYWAVASLAPQNQAGSIASITRIPASPTLSGSNVFDINSTGTNSSQFARAASIDDSLEVANGAYLTNTQTQAGISALIPFYSDRKFVGTHPRSYSRNYNAPTTWAYSNRALAGTESTEVADFYCAAGPDFSLHFFVGVPTLIESGVPLPAV
jgi:hypothetical protein